MPQLLFLYNADAGLGNALLDTFHKVLSPATYPCSLCGLTYGLVSMRPEWKAFLRTLPVPTRFLYRDQLPQEFPALSTVALPAIYYQAETGALTAVLPAAELARLDLPGLIQRLQQWADQHRTVNPAAS